MPKIKVLSEEVVKKIAAGEVVEGPYSVVKELVENSLDAGARRIEVSVERGGLDAIRVTDDGCGMDREDALLAFKRHATSKIERLEDIFSIETLGFRGEALPSMSAVAKVICITRPHDAEVGTRVKAEVEVIDIEETGCPVGTTVEVRDLFHSVPARKKYLKVPEKEFGRILEVMTNKALARPEIMFRLSHNGKVVFDAPPAKDLRERIAIVYGLGVSKDLLRVDWSDMGVTLTGYVSKPHINRSRPTTHIIVNGRDILNRVIHRAMLEAYGPILPKGRYPYAVLRLELDPRRIDPNVHPAKTEVRFEEEAKVEKAVLEAVRQALSLGELVPPVDMDDLSAIGVRGIRGGPRPSIEAGGGVKGHHQATIDVGTGNIEVPISETAGRPKDMELDEAVRAKLERLPRSITIKGQAGDCYIVGETEEGLIIIDQHAAHEKVTYEELSRQLGEGKVQSQELLDPIAVELSAEEAEAMKALVDDLARLGFEVEPFGPRSCRVKGVPSVLGVTVEAGAIHDILADLWKGRPERKGKKGKSTTLDEVKDHVLRTMACHTSTRAGKHLDLVEMRALVQLLYKAKEPFNCPHGRPTMIFLPFSRLEKRFGRRT
jgi:DNA mismatch repair protein MutL